MDKFNLVVRAARDSLQQEKCKTIYNDVRQEALYRQIHS